MGAGRPQVAGQAPGRHPEGLACALHASVYPCSFTARICADSPDCETLKKSSILSDKGLTGTKCVPNIQFVLSLHKWSSCSDVPGAL